MPYNGISDGLYKIVCRSLGKLVDHYGILDVGNRTGLQGPFAQEPIVIHLTLEGLQCVRIEASGRKWRVVGPPVQDELAAIARMNRAAANPTYDLLANNCEHFANYVALAKRESKQLQTAGWIAATVAAALIMTQADSPDNQ